MRNYYLNSFDSLPLYVRVWDDAPSPKGVVLFLHDLGDHSGRYAQLASYLEGEGYIVLGWDARGFGATAVENAEVHDEEDRFALSVTDCVYVYRYFKREYNLPIFIMGQGYGAYLWLSALETAKIDPQGVVLSGAGMVTRAYLRTAGIGSLAEAKGLTAMVWKSVVCPSGDPKDGETLPSYTNDPLSGAQPTGTFDRQILDGIEALWQPARFNKLSAYSFAIFAGMEDSLLGKEAVYATKLQLELRAIGCKRVRFYGYQGLRHNVFQSPMHPRVWSHLLYFLGHAVGEEE